MLMLSILLFPVKTWAEKAAKQTMPSMALLEFLAEMQEVDGKLVSPMDMQPQREVTATLEVEQSQISLEQKQRKQEALDKQKAKAEVKP